MQCQHLPMSRGPGRIQQAILEAVAETPGTSDGRVHWLLADRARRADQAFYKSFRRALTRLRATGRVQVHQKRLQSLEEVAEHLPFRTRDPEVRAMRAKLLPALMTLIRQSERLFNDAQSERHVLERTVLEAGLNRQSTKYEALFPEWIKARSALLELLNSGAFGYAELAIRAYAKGRQLFERRAPIRHDSTLSEICDEILHESGRSSPPIELQEAGRALNGLRAKWIPPTLLGSAQLKASIYHVVDFSRSQRPRLKREAAEHLLGRHREYIEKLPGHKSRAQTRPESSPISKTVVFSQTLDRLVSRDVLKPFSFLALRDHPTRAL